LNFINLGTLNIPTDKNKLDKNQQTIASIVNSELHY